ncbi:hypothetical protein GCM10016455_22600 [Aliiroseovarius zhejiangensis]|uniref:Uncharacterized protein n=1 Tax=Aliiroseovarius zhejiangensis TaxID=1632025 RepID=A0ABQ3J1D0_9RHOB|nr:hypothetical protein GCM10016455_22600 [Aliiroseovarius zhejiangensis]
MAYSLGVGHQLLGEDPLEPFKVNLTYQDIEGNSYESQHGLNVVEFSARSASSPPITKIWRELEKITKVLKK